MAENIIFDLDYGAGFETDEEKVQRKKELEIYKKPEPATEPNDAWAKASVQQPKAVQESIESYNWVIFGILFIIIIGALTLGHNEKDVDDRRPLWYYFAMGIAIWFIGAVQLKDSSGTNSIFMYNMEHGGIINNILNAIPIGIAFVLIILVYRGITSSNK